MKKRIFLISLISLFASHLFSQDIIVKKDGTILNVYNLEESNHSYFYTLVPSSGATLMKIDKDEVFSIKKGKESTSIPYAANGDSNERAREAVTAYKTSEFSNKKGKNIYIAKTPDGHELNYAILSEAERTVTVVKGEYHEKEYVIPEYVNIDDIIYTVTEIDKEGFSNKKKITKIQYPMTLKKIGGYAFVNCNLEQILLPEGLEEIGDRAFFCVSFSRHISEISIPTSVKSIGNNCFRNCGKDTSFRGFCQAYFSNMPYFVTEGNCKSFGIDEVAVREYHKK